MIKTLMGLYLETDIDPNPHGLPFLLLKIKGGYLIIAQVCLNKIQTEELIKELQERLKEM